jgi:ABC-type transport system substrate-binding protein
MPHDVDPEGAYKWVLPDIPVYSRHIYCVSDPELQGLVNMFGYSIDNGWSEINQEWNTVDGNRPHGGGKTIIWICDEYPEKLNPLWYKTVYSADIVEPCQDGLISSNPYTHADMPWIATDWTYAAYTGPETGGVPGMYVKFWLRDDVEWQDGLDYTIDDAKWIWEFLRDKKIPKFRYFTKYITEVTTNVGENSVTAYLNETSQWMIYDLAGTADMIPPQVWKWVPDDQLLIYDPAANETKPTGAGARFGLGGHDGPVNQLYGTGPFFVQEDHLKIKSDGYADLLANRHWWNTDADISLCVEEMFHRAGDIGLPGVSGCDGYINALDLGSIGGDVGTIYVPPPYMDTDVCGPRGAPPDGRVDIDDLATCGKFFGEEKTVPPP